MGEKKRRRGDGEAYVSEGNVLFSPPTGPRGFLGFGSVYAGIHDRMCVCITLCCTHVDG